MKASELIYELQKMVDREGDLDIVVHDGLSPSDPAIAQHVSAGCIFHYGTKMEKLDNKVIYISCN